MSWVPPDYEPQGGYEQAIDPGIVANAANIIFGTNPAYGFADFLAIYPQFGAVTYSGALTTPGSAYSVANGVPVTGGLGTGMTINITAVDGLGGITAFAIANPGTGYEAGDVIAPVQTGASGASITLAESFTGILPSAVLQMYINLASASLAQARWQDSWQVGMSLFIAHFATLYAQSVAAAGSTAAQVAGQAVSRGIQVSESAGDVSVSYQSIAGDLEGWAAWNLTAFGQQFATFAKIIGMGPMWVW